MTERSYPFVDGATTDAEFSAMFRTVFPASVLSGLVVSGDSSGLNVKVSAGAGYVRGHYYSSDAQVTLAIDGGDASPRIDTVVLRLEYGSVNNVHLVVKKGTPAATPVAPTLTQTDSGVYEFPLADVAVAASAVTISAANVTSRRVLYQDAFKEFLQIAWAAITGKPSSFPNDDVTGAVAIGHSGGGSKLARFSSAGQLAVSAPTANDQVARLLDVNLAIAPISFATADGTATAAPGKLVKWGVSGNLASPEPTADAHLANKKYVDDHTEIGGLAYAATEEIDNRVDDLEVGKLKSSVYGNEITSTRRAVWISSGGQLGYASSSRFKKQDILPAELTVEQLRGIPVVLYRYRKAVAAEKAGKIDHAATEIGTIAEDLHDLGLWQFVMYEDGKPAGVHYELLSLAALSLAQHLADHLDEIDARLTAAGL